MYTVQTHRPEPRSVPTGAGTRLEPLTPGLRAAVEWAAGADDHRVIAPTHGVLRGNGEVIGYVSLGVVPMFFAWMRRDRPGQRGATARESYAAWRAAEQVLKDQGHGLVCLPCEAMSPYAGLLERQGYETIGTALITLKQL